MASAVTGALSSLSSGGSFLSSLKDGITMPKIALIALTLFPPTGIIGLNWVAVGNSPMAFIKAMSFVIITFAIIFLTPFYPFFIPYKAISALTLFGPWYAYDVLQILDKSFDEDGFTLPIPIKDLPAQGKLDADGKWKLTLPLGSMIVATLLASGFAIADYLPNSMQTYFKYASAGGGTLFTGIAAVSGLTSTTSGGGPTPSTTTLLQGGGSRDLPPLSTFIDKLRYKKTKTASEALAFFSILGIIVFGGIITNVFKRSVR